MRLPLLMLTQQKRVWRSTPILDLRMWLWTRLVLPTLTLAFPLTAGIFLMADLKIAPSRSSPISSGFTVRLLKILMRISAMRVLIGQGGHFWHKLTAARLRVVYILTRMEMIGVTVWTAALKILTLEGF